jgi:hypothetical protein
MCSWSWARVLSWDWTELTDSIKNPAEKNRTLITADGFNMLYFTIDSFNPNL